MKWTAGKAAACLCCATALIIASDAAEGRWFREVSYDDARVHFGLGSADSIERMEVHWSSGLVENFPVPAVDRLYKLKEGTGKP